jgi:hypothetical protein
MFQVWEACLEMQHPSGKKQRFTKDDPFILHMHDN